MRTNLFVLWVVEYLWNGFVGPFFCLSENENNLLNIYLTQFKKNENNKNNFLCIANA